MRERAPQSSVSAASHDAPSSAGARSEFCSEDISPRAEKIRTLPAGTTRVKAAPKFFSTQARIAAGTLAAASSAETNAACDAEDGAASSRTKDASGGNGASCDGATDASSTSA